MKELAANIILALLSFTATAAEKTTRVPQLTVGEGTFESGKVTRLNVTPRERQSDPRMMRKRQ